MANKIVEVIISAKDLTGAVVSKFQRRWRAMERTIRTVTRSVVAFAAVSAAALVGLTKLGERGEEVNAVKRAFARITDDETAALKRLRQASAGTIEDFKLMSLANQAVTLGAAKSVDQFAEMVEVSRALGRAQGVDALSALESLTIGLARQSPRILDNIGIQIKLGDATTFAARAMEQAREKAAALSGEFGGGASVAARFRTAMVNLKDGMATFVAESKNVTDFFNGLSDVIDGVRIAIQTQNWSALGDLFKAFGKLAGDSWIAGWNQVFASLPENTAFDRWIMDRIPGANRISQWWRDNFMTQRDVFGGGAEEGISNVKTDLREIEQILLRLRSGQGPGSGGGGGGLAGLAGSPDLASPSIRRLDLSPFAGGRAAFQARRERLNRARSGPVGLMPGSIGPVSPLAQLTPEQQAAADAQNEADAINVASRQVQHAQRVVAASMFGMAQAAVRGTDQVAESVVSMITQIAQSIPGVGGVLGTVIAGVGGLIGAAVGRRDRAVPVRLAEVDDAAAKKLAENSGEPIRIVSIIEQGGVEIERIERELVDRQNRDETVRFSRGRPLDPV